MDSNEDTAMVDFDSDYPVLIVTFTDSQRFVDVMSGSMCQRLGLETWVSRMTLWTWDGEHKSRLWDAFHASVAL